MTARRAAAVLATLLGLAAPAAAETQHLSYVVYFGYLPALDVATGIESGGGRYRVEAAVVPQNWISWAIPWTAKSEATGQLGEAGRIVPEHYLSTATWGSHKRQTSLDFAADGTLKTAIEPPKVEEGREAVPEAVPEALLKNVLDPVSAVMAMLDAAGAVKLAAAGQSADAAAPAAVPAAPTVPVAPAVTPAAAAATTVPGCPPTVPVFDGRRRFEIRAERQPDATMAPAYYSAYAGPALVCRLSFKSLAGGYRDGERSRFWQTEQPGAERPPIELWLAPLRQGAPPVPVYVAGKSILGWVTAYLASYSFE